MGVSFLREKKKKKKKVTSDIMKKANNEWHLLNQWESMGVLSPTCVP